MRTPRYRFFIATAAVMLFQLAAGGDAQAQPSSRFYLGGTVGAFSVSSDEVDDRSPAGGFLAGFALSRYIDAEVELTFPTEAFTHSRTGLSVSFAGPGATREEIERLAVTTRYDIRREVSSNFSAVVVFHPRIEARVTPGLVIGIANQRVHGSTTYTPVHVPDGVDPLNPNVVARTQQSDRNIGGLTIGGNVAIRLSRQLFIVPDVRYDYGSIGDEINNALRTSVRVVWRFGVRP